MKTIGLLGGMSWESSIEYERIINRFVRAELGGSASASLIIRSYDFAEIQRLQQAGDWEAAGRLLAADALHLQAGGAGLVILCTNTMHRLAPIIEAALDVPFLHIADATADAIVAEGLSTVGLLGTRFTMEGDFYVGKLQDRGLTVVTPDPDDRTVVHDVIFGELVRGVVSDDSRDRYLEVIDRLINRGAGGIIAGCTEIELLVKPADVSVAYFPTARIHAEAAAREALR